MDLNTITDRMSANAAAISRWLAGVEAAQARWRPSPEAWSLLEVVCHLYDEEREDFRQRVDYALHRPNDEWPPIHPQKWVTERSYITRDFGEMRTAWLAEREHSLAWLRGLSAPNWEAEHIAPWGGTMKAGEMLAAWLAHDYLHIRQINELMYAWHAEQAKPYEAGLQYAGDW